MQKSELIHHPDEVASTQAVKDQYIIQVGKKNRKIKKKM